MFRVTRLIDFADLHGLVDRQGRVADRGAGRCGGVPGGGAEIAAAAGAIDGIGVAVALGTRQGERAGREELVERSAMAVECDIAALGLGDLEQVSAVKPMACVGAVPGSVVGAFVRVYW
jgi:hypothetical protein